MKKVYIPWYDNSVGNMFKNRGWHVVTTVAEADLVCFTGGEDVSPSLYGHATDRTTYNNPSRDEAEMAYYKEAKNLGLPCVGICRGGQFLNVMNGGEMYQDVSSHGRAHEALINDKKMKVSSTHHQMMMPSTSGYVVGVAVGVHATRKYYDTNAKDFVIVNPRPGDLDIEVVVYQNDVCFQPHPEYANYDKSLQDCQDAFFDLIAEHCIKDTIPF